MRQLLDDAHVLLRLALGLPRLGSHAERLAAFYAPQAQRYDAFRARLLHGREAMLAALEVCPGMRVAELGGGTGHNLEVLAKSVPIEQLDAAYLVDLCPPLLEVARRRFAGQAKVEVIEADACTWRPEQAVDRVYFSYALSMIPDWEAALLNAWAMLAPGGRIGVVDFHLPQNTSRFKRAFWRRWFAHDGVYLSQAHWPWLKAHFEPVHAEARRAPLPYLPGLRAPYYLFVGVKKEAACTAAATA